MQEIKGTAITLTKGDSFYCHIELTKGGEPYAPEQADVVRFGLKKSFTDSEALVSKVIPNDTLILYLSPEDTKTLAIGKYVYDLEVTYANGDVDTPVNQADFNLVPEVI